MITVCSGAAGETCPAYLGPVLRAHWGVDDPAHATGTDEEITATFMNAYRILRSRIEAFLELPLIAIEKDQDREWLKAELERIAGSTAIPVNGMVCGSPVNDFKQPKPRQIQQFLSLPGPVPS